VTEPLEGALVAGTDPAWRDFLFQHPSALPYHHPAWVETVAETYRFRSFVFVVRSAGDEVVGGVPLVAVGGRLRGKRWVGLPFTDACPALAGPAVTPEHIGRLLAAEGERAGVSAIELRGPLGSAGAPLERGVVHELVLTNEDDLFKEFKPQVRRNIRKAQRQDLTLRAADTVEDLTETYFRLHTATRRRLGVPTQPRRFFQNVWERMLDRDLGFALLVYHRDEPIAGAVFLEWNDRMIYKFGASDARHWSLRPNNLLFWEAIKRGCERGAKVLDFGRSDLDDEGLRAFKRSWGAVETPLVYTTLGRPAESSEGSAAERLLKPVVRRSPLWVGRGIGEVFYRFGA
jgi:CelD/BcsL family acetyltransferase involved in cellulose biosynthesis